MSSPQIKKKKNKLLPFVLWLHFASVVGYTAVLPPTICGGTAPLVWSVRFQKTQSTNRRLCPSLYESNVENKGASLTIAKKIWLISRKDITHSVVTVLQNSPLLSYYCTFKKTVVNKMLLWICHFEHGQNSWTINQLLMKIINIVLYLFISYQQVWTKYQIQLSVCVAGGWFVVFYLLHVSICFVRAYWIFIRLKQILYWVHKKQTHQHTYFIWLATQCPELYGPSSLH